MTPPPPPERIRLDQLLVDRGLAPSRARAQARILAGEVLVGEDKIEKAGTLVRADAAVRLLGDDMPWVSRGGLKLAHALERLGIDPTGWRCLDIGASTGGFTDVLLTQGARAVICVDSGTNQLAWKMRQDSRVRAFEQTNARELTAAIIEGEPVDLVVMDVSFISQRLIIPAVAPLLREGGDVIALIKPQFEAGRSEVGSKGVVRDPAVQARVMREVAAAWERAGIAPQTIVRSEPPGPEGNREFFLHATKGGAAQPIEAGIAAALSEP